jgi:cardiolipin synthase
MSYLKFPKALRKLFDRRVFIAILILIQIVLLIVMLFRSFRLKWLETLLTAFSIITALHLLTRPDKSAFKLSLVFLILLFPVFGGAIYWVFHFQTNAVGYRKRLEQIEQNAKSAYLLPGPAPVEEIAQVIPASRTQIRYLADCASFPVYCHTETDYFPNGKKMMEQLLSDLQSAKQYIFLEYFILEQGVMWDSILKILRERADAGVDVRVIFDDLGCFLTLPPDYATRF